MDDPLLPKKARQILTDRQNSLMVSPVSFWEISLKRSLGKLSFDGDHDTLLQAGLFHSLVLTPRHAWLAGSLPLHHKDPFDRMLVAQAKSEGMMLLTHDRRLKPYGSFIQVV